MGAIGQLFCTTTTMMLSHTGYTDHTREVRNWLVPRGPNPTTPMTVTATAATSGTPAARRRAKPKQTITQLVRVFLSLPWFYLFLVKKLQLESVLTTDCRMQQLQGGEDEGRNERMSLKVPTFAHARTERKKSLAVSSSRSPEAHIHFFSWPILSLSLAITCI